MRTMFHDVAPALGDPFGADERADELVEVDELVLDLLFEQPANAATTKALNATAEIIAIRTDRIMLMADLSSTLSRCDMLPGANPRRRLIRRTAV